MEEPFIPVITDYIHFLIDFSKNPAKVLRINAHAPYIFNGHSELYTSAFLLLQI